LITFDPNLRLPLWKDPEEAKGQMLWGLHQADVVKISDEEVDFLFGPGVEAGSERICKEFGVKLVLVTCGADGCFFLNSKARGWIEGLTGLTVVDTTGAGDIFGGSALWKLLQFGKGPEDLAEDELREITRFACAAAGLSTEHPGGISSVPGLETVLARM
jgi:fructokinase